MTVIVQKNKDINLEDKINVEYSLDGKNTSEQDLILIYLYFLPNFPTHGIKVGMTKCKKDEFFWHALETRIKNQHHELALDNEQLSKYGNIREIIYWGVCLDTNNESFKDYKIHKEIKEKYPRLIFTEQEWFMNIPPKDIIDIFNEIRKNKNKEIFTPRKEQRKCINDLKNYFKENPIGGKFLLNCKMRFGKCYTTYKYCEENNIDKILILTFVPAVQESWHDDLYHIEKEYKYYTDDDLKKNSFFLKEKKDPFVIFLSLQNYLGKNNQNQVKNKIKKLQDIYWDLIIFDEYHFGALNNKTQETLEDLDVDYQNNLKKTKNIFDKIDKFKIKTKKTICLSGTPFKSLERGEFNDKTSSTYSYFDEQQNKYPNPNDMTKINPDYAQFPDIKIFAYNMKSMYPGLADKLISNDSFFNRKDYFSLNQFFETKKDYNKIYGYQFIYEKEIKGWLEIIKGSSPHGKNFPYSNPDNTMQNKHTIWLMPSVSSCMAITKLLQDDEYFKRYQIINLSDENVGNGKDALFYLKKKISEGEKNGKLGSISITVNKLTIGITVEKWSSIFILKDLSSPETYFQSIFRIQTPLIENKQIIKKYGYVYDFNIDRAASLLLTYADKSFEKFGYSKMNIVRLIIKYLPIYKDGNIEKPIDEEIFKILAQFGDNKGQTLSQKIKNTKITTWIQDDDTVAAMLNDNEVIEIFKLFFSHAKLIKSKKRDFPLKPEDNSFKNKITLDGENRGYELGKKDYKLYLWLDENQIQEEYDKNEQQHIKNNIPNNLDELHKNYYINGFKKGYRKGINVPIKKMYCGETNGIKFIDKIKEKFGSNITYTNKTKKEIEIFINDYLKNIDNIPKEYRGVIYKRWYIESFNNIIKKNLKPKINGDMSIQDLNNVAQHIITRLFEFLYISVYRETTFDEIFKNANPDVFLEAVGITKEDFVEKANKYHFFNEKILNNFIKEFFINETISKTNEKNKKEYRNSFNWFDFGITEKY